MDVKTAREGGLALARSSKSTLEDHGKTSLTFQGDHSDPKRRILQ